MRLFVAVDLSETAVDAARRTIARLQRRIARDEHVRWAPLSNLHLTVRFIGEVPDAKVDALIERVTAPLAVVRFRMALGGCGIFPTSGPPRVLWIGIGTGADGLRAMHDELDARLEPLGYPGEKRPFAAHLTLARVGQSRRSAAIRKAVAGAAAPEPAITRVDHAVLYRSHLSPRGARYEALRPIPLAAGTQVD